MLQHLLPVTYIHIHTSMILDPSDLQGVPKYAFSELPLYKARYKRVHGFHKTGFAKRQFRKCVFLGHPVSVFSFFSAVMLI